MSKQIKETKLGEWLSSKSPKILDVVGDLVPDKGVIGVIKRLVDSDPDVSAIDKLEFEKVAAQTEQVAQKEVTKRWQADMSSDVSLAKVIRPAVMIGLLLFFMFVMIMDAMREDFMPRESFIGLLELLMLTVFGAYFAGRTIEKTSVTRKK